MVRQARCGEDRFGEVRFGLAGKVRSGEASLVQARSVKAWYGVVRYGRNGKLWNVTAG